MPRILLVEDEPAIAETVLYALRTEGFEARHCLTGGEALRAVREDAFDLAVLDVGLPDIGGFALCRELRRLAAAAGHDLPVIFLTAHDAEAERILGLEIGADDYVTKPFSPRELVARVRVVLRRGHGGSASTGSAHGFEHDADGHRIRYRGCLLDLTRYEYGLLAALLQRPGAVLSRAQLMDRVWRRPGQRRPHHRHPHQDAAREAALGGAGCRPDPHPSRDGLLAGVRVSRCP